MREIVELQPEFALSVLAEDLVEFSNLAGIGIYLEELVSQHSLKLPRVLFERHRRLQNLEDARLVHDADTALVMRRVTERRELIAGPFRLDVAWRHDGDQRGDAAKPFD